MHVYQFNKWKHNSPQFCWLLIKFIISKVNNFINWGKVIYWGNSSICLYACLSSTPKRHHLNIGGHLWKLTELGCISYTQPVNSKKVVPGSSCGLNYWMNEQSNQSYSMWRIKINSVYMSLYFCATFIARRCRQGFSELLNVVIKLCGRAILGRGCGGWSCPFKF